MLKRVVAARDQSPPLWLWALVAALVLGLLGASLPDYFSSEVTDIELSRAARRERVRSFRLEVAAEPRDVTVIALGDSAIRYATFVDEEMQAFLAATTGLGVHFLRLSDNGASLGTFVNLLDEILAVRPDVLVLQAGLLRRRPKVKFEEEHHAFQSGEASAPAYTGRQRVKRLLRGNDPFRHQQFFSRRYFGGIGIGQFADENWARRMERREDRGNCTTSHRGSGIERFLQKYPRDFEHGLHPLVAASASILIERAADAGVTLVFAEIPRGGQMERLAAMRARRMAARAFTADPIHRGVVRHWRSERQPPSEHYCDWAHMSPAGRDAYSLWLGERLAALFGDGAPL